MRQTAEAAGCAPPPPTLLATGDQRDGDPATETPLAASRRIEPKFALRVLQVLKLSYVQPVITITTTTITITIIIVFTIQSRKERPVLQHGRAACPWLSPPRLSLSLWCLFPWVTHGPAPTGSHRELGQDKNRKTI